MKKPLIIMKVEPKVTGMGRTIPKPTFSTKPTIGEVPNNPKPKK